MQTYAHFPAVLIGGPPHSGKSVLVYSLTQTLRGLHVPHYVLRACPDGEGDWANEADQLLVKTLRSKGPYSRPFIERVVRDLQRRHLPLLVDVGGKPKPWQETVFAACNYAILLVADRPEDAHQFEAEMQEWREMMLRNGVPVIAELKSVLHGQNSLQSTFPQVIGTMAGLVRGQQAQGESYEALVARLRRLFNYSPAEVAQQHMAQSPAELGLNLETLAQTLDVAGGRWQPHHLPILRDYLPAGQPLAVYGRGPNWLYAALALQAAPAGFWLFDVRLGWVAPPVLPIVSEEGLSRPVQQGWETVLQRESGSVILNFKTQSQYLDIEEPELLPIVQPPTDTGLILSGKIPHWLLIAASIQMAPTSSWLGIYQPMLKGAVIAYSRVPDFKPGQVVPVTPEEPNKQ